MKIFLVVTVFVSWVAQADPCGGSPVGYWTNPDGSRGGSVGKDAKVQAGAVIAPGAEVCEFAQVKTGAQILGQARIGGRAVINTGSIIDGRAKVQGEAKIGGSGSTTKVAGDATVEGSAVITGASHVYARAKVGGGAKVHNSIICQASVIEGISVTDSDYYCQTEDPEPPHPGEAGKATLLGVDVDRDGVRDDLEIWINDYFSNTPTKNRRLTRMEFKQISKDLVSVIKDSRSKDKVINNYRSFERSLFCLNSTEGIDVIIEASKMHDAQLVNTSERSIAYMNAQNHMAGKGYLGSDKGKNSCRFK